MSVDSPIILAVDTTDVGRCSKLIQATSDSVGIYKFGLEFYLKNGAEGIKEIRHEFPEIRIFLDLKLHDIPNTVGAAAESVADLRPEILTVHASGGSAMVAAAARALPETSVAAVTILTSLSESDLLPFGRISLPQTTEELARAAVSAGARAIVTSPNEVSALRKILDRNVKLITPGIRPEGSSSDDQTRVATPKSAMAAGADFLVIGRPITGAANPARAAAEIFASIR